MGNIKGTTKRVREAGQEVSYTFSNEDLSIAMECTVDKSEILAMSRYGVNPLRGILPSCAEEHFKKSGQLVKLLEDTVEALNKLINAGRSGTSFTLRYEFYENGNMKAYFDNRLVAQAKASEEDMEVFLRDCRYDI